MSEQTRQLIVELLEAWNSRDPERVAGWYTEDCYGMDVAIAVPQVGRPGVRRMFEAVGVVVSRLMRVRYGPFVLPPNLKRGKVLEIGEADVKKLLAEFGMEDQMRGRPLRRARES